MLFASCGRLGLNYLSKLQYHRLFKEIEAADFILCHREFRVVQVEIAAGIDKELNAYLEAYRMLAHNLFEAKQVTAVNDFMVYKKMQETYKAVKT